MIITIDRKDKKVESYEIPDNISKIDLHFKLMELAFAVGCELPNVDELLGTRFMETGKNKQ